MKVQRLAAFSSNGQGGNPAGVAILAELPGAAVMQAAAARIAYSETVFAAPEQDGWRVRYFAPDGEVPFCGHATIALGAALAMQSGDGVFNLALNEARITVEGRASCGVLEAALQSPPTWSRPLEAGKLAEILRLFGLNEGQLDDRIPPAVIHGGADHVVLALRDRQALSCMSYALDAGRQLMRAGGWITVMLVHVQSNQRFNARNAFAWGGVYEDPATGAAAAAFAGYLRDMQWPHAGAIEIVQGEDMGQESCIHADIPAHKGSAIRVYGNVRSID